MKEPRVDLPSRIEALPALDEVLSSLGIEAVSPDYRELHRSDTRLVRLGDGTLLVFRNDDLRRLGAHPSVGGMPRELNLDMLFRCRLPADITDAELGEVRRFFTNVITNLEKPAHDVMKPIFARALTPRAMQDFSPVMERLVEQQISAVASLERFDLLRDFAFPIGLALWAEVLGFSEDEREGIAAALEGVGMAVAAMISSRDELAASNAGLAIYFEILSTAIKRARAVGGCPFVDTMVDRFEALSDVPDAMPESLETCVAASMSDGFHTMAMGATNVMAALLSRPAAYAQVRSNTGLVSSVVSEGLRLHAPLSMFYRHVSEDMEYDGLMLPRGQVLSMLWGAGNTDPAVYPDPGHYDLTRPRRPSTTFGTGEQLCPGRDLVAAMATAVVKALSAADVSVELLAPVTWTETPPINTVNIATGTPVCLRRAT